MAMEQNNSYTDLAVRCVVCVKKAGMAGMAGFAGIEPTDVLAKLRFVSARLQEQDIDLRRHVAKWTRFGNKESAAIWRKTGNDMYRKKKFQKALECYTKALNVCPPERLRSKEMALCLGNQSAVLFEMGDFRNAEVSAQLALLCTGLPEENRRKLVNRIEVCKASNLNQLAPDVASENGDLTTIGQVQQEEEGLTIVYDPGLGRHAVAKRDLRFGDVIFVDSPICSVPTSALVKNVCNHCLTPVFNETVASPFDRDISFCSSRCLADAFLTYHVYESRLNMQVFFFRPNPMENLTKKLLQTLRLVLRRSADEHEAQGCGQVQYGCGMDSMADMEHETALDSLLTHFEHADADQHLGFAVNTLLLLHVLREVGYIRPEDPQSLEDALTLRLHHCQGAVLMNSHTVHASLVSGPKSVTNEHLDIGSALYHVLPLLNHSCRANTLRFNLGSKVVLVASEDIGQGQEISDSYGINYMFVEREERRRSMRSRFYFDCECRACVGDYPLYDQVPRTLKDQDAMTEFDLAMSGIGEILSFDQRDRLPEALELCRQAFAELQRRQVPEVHYVRERLTILMHTVYQRMCGSML